MSSPDPDSDRAERKMQFLYALRSHGVTDARVLTAMEKVDRGPFVRGHFSPRAYEDTPLPIACGQTISQPSVVGLMTQALRINPRDKLLEVGTGSGYQTAVLAELVTTVFTVERIKPLSEMARRRLAGLSYRNIHFGYADGINGWPPYAPYDGIIVTAGAAAVPEALIQQLSPSGRLIIPVGPQGAQSLRVIDRRGAGTREQDMGAVSFVPLLAGKV